MIIYETPGVPDHIPVIDLTGAGSSRLADRQQVARQIGVACRQTGFFYVSGHGVPDAQVGGIFAQAKRFFDLPLDRKMALHMRRSPSSAGYEPMGGQRLDSQDADTDAAPPDLKEAFYIGRELASDDPMSRRKTRNFGHNQWPEGLDGFKPALIAYYDAMRALADRVLAVLALSLGVPETWFEAAYAMPTASLRFIRYPPHPDHAAFNQLGAGAHTDWGGITLLAQDSSGGLEVRNAAGDWIEAPPIAGTFVVNLGDLTSRWTNGYYASNLHRVKNTKTKRDRYSVPFFYGPSPDAVIEPIPGTVTAAHPRRFTTCTASDHMAEMFERSYGYRPGVSP